MAVIVEALAVIVKNGSIIEKHPGALEGYAADVPNSTFCTDGHISCVSFMHFEDVEEYIRRLKAKGLVHLERDSCVDIAVADQYYGLVIECDWLDFVQVALSGGGVCSACALEGTDTSTMAVPSGWTFETSFTLCGFRGRASDLEGRLEFLHRQGGVDVYLDKTTGRKVYIGRSN